MKKKALATKMAAFVMAGAMTMSMGGFTAFAAKTHGESGDIPLTKIVEASNDNEYVYAPNTSFNFEVKAVDTTSTFNNNFVKAGLKNEDGSALGVSLTPATATFAPAEGEFDKTITQINIKVNYNDIYTNEKGGAGIYHYVVKEVKPEEADRYEGITYSEDVYNIYVYVYEDNTADATVVEKDGKVLGTKTDESTHEKFARVEFTNTYDVHTLTITKKVDGNQGEKNRDFEFKLAVDGGIGEKYYYRVLNGTEVVKYGTIDSKAYAEETATKIELEDTWKVEVYGLSATDKYTVVEKDYTGEGYTTTITKGSTKLDENVLTATDTISDNTTVEFLNAKSVSTPTGIVTEYAPYILLVAAAGAFAVLFLRRKKEEF